jgi:ppGpp synthetase/RelA/SpoT-type nucleotidyltranferase
MEIIGGSQDSIADLETEYSLILPLANNFCEEVKKQIAELIVQNGLTLAFPVEYRVKTWQSLVRKIQDKSLNVNSVKELKDLIGLRLILLFLRDIPEICKLLEKNFNIIEKEEAFNKLKESEFGYLSLHYVIELPEPWFAIPSLSHLKGYRSEIQIRTAAQHIWAAASHKLQYKIEDSVPIPVRRSIHRVAAILETVDSELEQVLKERENYIGEINMDNGNQTMNIDLLKNVLNLILPKENYYEYDNYAGLFKDLLSFEIDTISKLKNILQKNLRKILYIDYNVDSKNRFSLGLPEAKQGIKKLHYTQVGLARLALREEFGKEWDDYEAKINKVKINRGLGFDII